MSKSAGGMNNYLIVYDRASGRQISLEEFGDNSDAAISRYQDLEQANAGNPRMDVVLIGSDSLETVRVTHASYFAEGVTTLEDLEEYLRDFAHQFGVPQP